MLAPGCFTSPCPLHTEAGMSMPCTDQCDNLCTWGTMRPLKVGTWPANTMSLPLPFRTAVPAPTHCMTAKFSRVSGKVMFLR
jgi:hypothetical protein